MTGTATPEDWRDVPAGVASACCGEVLFLDADNSVVVDPAFALAVRVVTDRERR